MKSTSLLKSSAAATIFVVTSLATSFRSMSYTYHHVIKHLHTNIILSIFFTYFVLKCATKIGSQIKLLCPEIFSNTDSP